MNLIIIFGASYLYLVILGIAVVVFLCLDRYQRKPLLKLLILTSIFAYIPAKLGGLLIHDPRPFVVEHIQPLIHAATDNGFPSDHTLLSMVIALVVLRFNKKVGSLLVVLALLVGVARVLAHAHHVIDIVGSIVIAVIAIWLSQALLKGCKDHNKSL